MADPYDAAMTRTRFNPSAIRIFLSGGALLVLSAWAAAQSDIVRPPKAEDPEDVSFILTLGVAVLCAAVVVGINLMPSRRTHQD